ncbi:hypothetical protein [Sinomonas atrocyanea]
MTMHSATLAINEAIQKRRAAGEDVLHLGFGEAGLPVPGFIAEVLQGAVGNNGYGSVVGSAEARQAAADWFCRRGSARRPGRLSSPLGARRCSLQRSPRCLAIWSLPVLPG